MIVNNMFSNFVFKYKIWTLKENTIFFTDQNGGNKFQKKEIHNQMFKIFKTILKSWATQYEFCSMLQGDFLMKNNEKIILLVSS